VKLDERIAKIEAILAEQEGGRRLKCKMRLFAELLLWLVATAAPVVWTYTEFLELLINRYWSLRHSLHW
jgi:hypothetical protein